jgi:hypothetical protein
MFGSQADGSRNAAIAAAGRKRERESYWSKKQRAAP